MATETSSNLRSLDRIYRVCESRRGTTAGVANDGTVGSPRPPTVQPRCAREPLEGWQGLVAEAARDVVFIAGLDGVLQYVNGFAARQVGARAEDLLGRRLEALFPGGDSAGLARQVGTVAETGEPVRVEHEVCLARRGTWLDTCLSPVRDEWGRVGAVLGISREVTELVRARQEWRRLSLVDELTGLYNRRGFLAAAVSHLKLAERTGGGVSLLVADVDDLKGINDTFGHQEGDRALVAAGSLLKGACRESDLVARLGGDEFVLLAVGAGPVDAHALVGRLGRAVESWNEAGQLRCRLSLSVGAVHLDPRLHLSTDLLLRRADSLMYDDKRGKGNRRCAEAVLPV